uniref:Uncharacterized protein n=1 Tax=Physcomitrium patens TaxID=3218 RepID=A0A2K1IUQ6_PHYPA|nr:hypothetical protein PHYPA_024950 [Physcomitrium patens]
MGSARWSVQELLQSTAAARCQQRSRIHTPNADSRQDAVGCST